MMQGPLQYNRKSRLLVARPGADIDDAALSVIDLSNMNFHFKTVQADLESPNNASIRIFNLAQSTVDAIQTGQYSRVILEGGYRDTGMGVLFDGTIKYFREGRINATDTYLDLLTADGDIAYNFAHMSTTLAAGWTHAQAINEAIKATSEKGVSMGYVDAAGLLGGTIPKPRGKVMFGLPRVMLRRATESTGSTWNIENGKINVVPLRGFRPGEVLELSASSGLIGRAEQTEEGIRAKCLLNPRLQIAGLVRINNASVNRLVGQNPNAPVPYNQYTGLQHMASVSADGLYRVFVVEHEGEVRGEPWYSDIVCLAVNPVTKEVKPHG